MKHQMPSLDQWLREAKAEKDAPLCGMYLAHNGTVRQTARALVRNRAEDTAPVSGMHFAWDRDKVSRALEEACARPGIYHVRLWLNEGDLALGDDIMLVLVGGDIRPRVIDALQFLVGKIKNECVVEQEIY